MPLIFISSNFDHDKRQQTKENRQSFFFRTFCRSLLSGWPNKSLFSKFKFFFMSKKKTAFFSTKGIKGARGPLKEDRGEMGGESPWVENKQN